MGEKGETMMLTARVPRELVGKVDAHAAALTGDRKADDPEAPAATRTDAVIALLTLGLGVQHGVTARSTSVPALRARAPEGKAAAEAKKARLARQEKLNKAKGGGKR